MIWGKNTILCLTTLPAALLTSRFARMGPKNSGAACKVTCTSLGTLAIASGSTASRAWSSKLLWESWLERLRRWSPTVITCHLSCTTSLRDRPTRSRLLESRKIEIRNLRTRPTREITNIPWTHNPGHLWRTRHRTSREYNGPSRICSLTPFRVSTTFRLHQFYVAPHFLRSENVTSFVVSTTWLWSGRIRKCSCLIRMMFFCLLDECEPNWMDVWRIQEKHMKIKRRASSPSKHNEGNNIYWRYLIAE